MTTKRIDVTVTLTNIDGRESTTTVRYALTPTEDPALLAPVAAREAVRELLAKEVR